jgi:hypothetical protein
MALPAGPGPPNVSTGSRPGSTLTPPTILRTKGDVRMTGPTSTPEPSTGGCRRGAIAYEVTGSPDDPHLCSCAARAAVPNSPPSQGTWP